MSQEVAVSLNAFDLSSPGGFLPSLKSPPELVVYLHGFRSSPSSLKAQKVMSLFESKGLLNHLWVPQLPASPAQAIALIQNELADRFEKHPNLNLAFVGSSLGGFYATVLAEKHPMARVVLLNPAINPHLDLQDQIGRQKVYFSDEEIEFVPQYLEDLQAARPTALTGLERYFLIGATGDEVLCHADMQNRYNGAHQLTVRGSDHALSDFDQWLPFMTLFLGVQ